MTSFLFYIGVIRYHSKATNALVKFLAMINLYLFLSSTTLFELELIKGGTDKNKVKTTQKEIIGNTWRFYRDNRWHPCWDNTAK